MQLNPDALVLARSNFHTHGAPRNFQLADDGKLLYFTRADTETSNVQSLWRLTVSTGKEELLFNPLTHHSSAEPTAEEDKQRERLRETSHGVTGYALRSDGLKLCFSLGGTLWLVDIPAGTEHSIKTRRVQKFRHVTGAFDPRFSPDSTTIGYVTGEAVWTIGLDTAAKPRQIVRNVSPEIYFGRAEFIASEEFERYRGFWWSPDSTHMVIARVDETVVHKSYGISADPWSQPQASPYPAAGTLNAVVSLDITDINTLQTREITWDKTAFPYLCNVQWKTVGLHITVQSRDQRELRLYMVTKGDKTVVTYHETAEPWVDIIQPLPMVTDSGAIIGLCGTNMRRLSYKGTPVTPADQHVDDFIGMLGDWLVYSASPDPKERIVSAVNVVTKKTKLLSPTGGLFSGLTTSQALYISGGVMGSVTKLRHVYSDVNAKPVEVQITSNASRPTSPPQPIFFTVGPDKLEASLVLPISHSADQKLPIILQVYGGPHHQEVLYSQTSYLEAQWWANQGYAVLSTDGPGTPGRSLTWEQRIAGDLITEVAAAQIAVLDEALYRYPFLDGSRVASRGWSFGGYLSAFLSVLYPSQVQASISGAPVTDWQLYDTHYTERYLGLPSDQTHGYKKSSLLEAAPTATRPILLIHGLHDDNVLIAHSLQLLQVLGEANCPYQFIPLSSASHFTKEAEQRAWLLQMELEFLRSNLGEPNY